VEKLNIKQMVSAYQNLRLLTAFNAIILIPICLIILIFGIAANASAIDICTTAPTSSLVVNVKDKGAKGNGIADDTAAIQAAVDQVAGTGGTVLVPDGAYLIDAITSINIKSDMTLRMSKGTILKALPNGKTGYKIINITGASNVNIIGGTVIGERDEHSGTTGEWGMGIMLVAANNTVIEGVTVKNCWGDGFLIMGASKNVKFCSVIADNNRRQGMSITSVDGMVVKNSVFKNTGGTAPQAGIDLEPDTGDTINKVQIVNSQFTGNKGLGILFYQGAEPIFIKNVTIDGNTISSNLSGGIGLINTSGHRIINNLFKDIQNYSIYMDKDSKDNTVTGNTVTGKNSTIINNGVGGNSVSGNILN
jgi:polygalacturonase